MGFCLFVDTVLCLLPAVHAHLLHNFRSSVEINNSAPLSVLLHHHHEKHKLEDLSEERV